MEELERQISQGEDVSAQFIDHYFSHVYAKSIVRMLIKLGIKPGEVYLFSRKKKRLRQLEDHEIGICYYIDFDHDAYTEIDVDGTTYNIVSFFKMDYIEELENESNRSVVQTINMEWWYRVYNYLRIELNVPKGKREVMKTQNDNFSLLDYKDFI
jgi:hypothetical protein